MASVTTPQKTRPTSSLATPESHAKAQELPVSKKKRVNGIWQNGQWWCNCDPRRQATLREVKKEGRNKGRLFWACRVYPFCDLFLWSEDADVRQKRISKFSRQYEDEEQEQEQEQEQEDDDHDTSGQQADKPKTPTFTQKPLESFGIQTSPARRLSILGPADADDDGGSDSTNTSFVSTDIMREHVSASEATNPASPTTPSSKRKRTAQDNCDNDDNFSDLNSDEERELAEMADDNVQKVAPAPNPKDAVDDVFATPATNRGTAKIVAGLPTPPVSRTLFPSSDGKRPKTVSFEDPSPSSTLMTPSKRPPPSTVPRPGASASTSASTAAPTGPFCDSIQDLANQVMDLIKGQNMDPSLVRSVQGRLNTALHRTKGMAMGRDRALEALKERDERIKKLQERNRELKKQVARDKETLTNTKRRLMALYDDI
ncbi:hypothetical protein E4U54_008596 [Claviceps lovelessii]|nr:hypothetical protein E4U54_008596 [Claviceps lovelessii]